MKDFFGKLWHGSSYSSDKPDIDTYHYSGILKSAVECIERFDQCTLLIYIQACDYNGKQMHKINRIRCSFQFAEIEGENLPPYYKKVIQEEFGKYACSIRCDEGVWGETINGITAHWTVGFDAFVKDENFKHYAYILQRLGEQAARTNGVREVRVTDGSWRNGFYVMTFGVKPTGEAPIVFKSF